MGGKAEIGSTKWLANNMKSKGLQRLRWYCQVCERQMRDENGFKQHCLSEAHNRNMQVVGENSKKFISNYSEDFKKDFLRLLRTAHGEKKVHANHFYQQYISDKQHVHMNATRWPSLSEFVKYLGREGICRVEEGERGLEISWIDDSPEALRRREAVAKRERLERGDEDREAKLLEAQIKRAREQKKEQDAQNGNIAGTLERRSDAPVTLSLGGSRNEKLTTEPAQPVPEVVPAPGEAAKSGDEPVDAAEVIKEPSKPMSFSMGSGAAKPKPVNVFSSKGNALKSSKPAIAQEPKKVSALERVMLEDKEAQERKRHRTAERDGEKPKRIRL